MSKQITRRQTLGALLASTGLLLSSTDRRKAYAWPPGPDENLARDLTPGPSPIRLAINIKRENGESPEAWTLDTWKLLVASIRQVLRDTAGMKAAIGMEAQITTIIDGPQAHKRLMEDVGDDRLKVNLDPVNMMCLERYYHTTELINECFDLLGEDIVGCHSKDTFIWPDKQTVHVQEVCPGRGVLDYETYLVRMSRLSWPRALEAEHIPDEEYPEARAYVERVAKKIGVKLSA